jgi:hypothetical protein
MNDLIGLVNLTALYCEPKHDLDHYLTQSFAGHYYGLYLIGSLGLLFSMRTYLAFPESCVYKAHHG